MVGGRRYIIEKHVRAFRAGIDEEPYWFDKEALYTKDLDPSYYGLYRIAYNTIAILKGDYVVQYPDHSIKVIPHDEFESIARPEELDVRHF